MNLKPLSVVLRQVGIDLFDQLHIVSPLFIQPEDNGCLAQARAGHRQLHPVLNRRVLHLAHPPDIACRYRVFKQSPAVTINHCNCPVCGDLECLVV